MQITINYYQIFINLAVSYGIPAAIYIFYVNKKYGITGGLKSKVIKFFWLIALIIFASALTPITREILYPSSSSAISQNEIYRGILLSISALLILLVGYVVGFFIKAEKTIENSLSTKVEHEIIEQAKHEASIDINLSSVNSNVVDAFQGFKKGLKEGITESEEDSKSMGPARFVNLNGGKDKRIPRTLSDYLWQSFFSLIIGLTFGFVAYEAVVKYYENENSIITLLGIFLGSIGFLIFIGLALIYVFRLVQVVNERGIKWRDFVMEGQLLAVVLFIGLIASAKNY